MAAVRLVEVLPNERLRVTDEGRTMLESDAFNDHNLFVVSSCGPARIGKSHFLNRLIELWDHPETRQQGMFDVASTNKHCTQGLWVWNQPLHDGDRKVLLVDVQGCNAVATSRTLGVACTNALYCVAYTISGLLLWSSRETINVDDLSSVNTLVECLNAYRDPDAAAIPKPVFCWVLRDGDQLDLETADGEDASPDEYFADLIKRHEEYEPIPKQCCKTLLSAFRDRQLVRVPRPAAIDPRLFKQNDLQALGEPFINGVVDVRKSIEKCGGQLMGRHAAGARQGDFLCGILDEICDIINSRGVLQMDRVILEVADASNTLARRQLIEQLRNYIKLKEVKDKEVTSSSTLRKCASEVMEDYLKRFRDGFIGTGSQKTKAVGEFKVEFQAEVDSLAQMLELRLLDEQQRNMKDFNEYWASFVSYLNGRSALDRYTYYSSSDIQAIIDELVHKLMRDTLRFGPKIQSDAQDRFNLESIEAFKKRAAAHNSQLANKFTMWLLKNHMGWVMTFDKSSPGHLICKQPLAAHNLVDKPKDLAHVFLDRNGRILGRLPRNDDVVAIWSCDHKALWLVKTESNSFVHQRMHWIRAHGWELGSSQQVPRECLFRVIYTKDVPRVALPTQTSWFSKVRTTLQGAAAYLNFSGKDEFFLCSEHVHDFVMRHHFNPDAPYGIASLSDALRKRSRFSCDGSVFNDFEKRVLDNIVDSLTSFSFKFIGLA